MAKRKRAFTADERKAQKSLRRLWRSVFPAGHDPLERFDDRGQTTDDLLGMGSRARELFDDEEG